MDQAFHDALHDFYTCWKASSLQGLQKFISEDYKAREISRGEIVDFGYEESIRGWEQGFAYVKGENGSWELEELSVIQIRDDEYLVVVTATIIVNEKSLDTVNLFFDTFKKIHEEWKLVRSYIEAGVPKETLHKQIRQKGFFAGGR